MDLSKLSDADLLALRSGDLSKVSNEGLRSLKGAPLPMGKPPTIPPAADTGEHSIWEDIKGGLASAPINLYLGGKQLLGKELTPVEQDVLQQNREAENRAPISSVASNILTAIPAAMIPGANTIAGGALIGAGQGALQPTTEGESRLNNMLVGGVAGGAIPAALRAGKVAKAALFDPFTQGGQEKIAAGAIQRAAGNPNFAQSMRMGATPGFNPTLAQATGDEGIAALERSVKAANPGAFGSMEQSQRQALAEAVRNIAKDPIARQSAIEAREGAANTLYGRAFNADAMRRDLANQAQKAAKPFTGSGLSAAKEDLATPGLRELAQRPMFKQAVEQARSLAANKGIPLDDPLQSLQGLHYVKLALDDMANPQATSALGRNASAAINEMRTQLGEELGKIAPTYGAARETFKEMSRPINQMDIGQAFQERLIPAIYRDMDAPQQLNAAAFARALRDQGNDIARNATGMGSSTLENTLEPAQLQGLNNVASDLQMMKIAENAGRGVGSDTAQKLAMSHLAAESGVPNWAMSLGKTAPAGWLRRAADILYGGSDDAVKARLAEMLMNPNQVQPAIRASQPSAIAEALRRMAITGGQALPGLAAQ